MKEPRFKVGDPVKKVTGDYLFPGEVRAVFTTRRGEVRYVVECTEPGVAGMLHIYSEKNLAVRYIGEMLPVRPGTLLKGEVA